MKRRYESAARVALIALAITAVSASVVLVGAWLCGYEPWWFLRAGLLGPRTAATILLFGVMSLCALPFIRPLFEHLGILEPEDTWQDWRDEPVASLTAEGATSAPRNRAWKIKRMFGSDWTTKNKLRSRRPSPPRVTRR
jgi:hypothetical protein